MKEKDELKYKNDVDVKKALGIESFRNLSKENVMRFAAMMPDMDKEVALKVVAQFPEFKVFALEAINTIQAAQEKSLASNSESQSQAHQAWSNVRAILKGQLDDGELAWEQKRDILELIMETARQESAKDSENKQFLKDLSKYVAYGVVGIATAAVVFVGGRVGIDQLLNNDDGKV